jgi:dolichol-phosphate mannosyltransferase
MQTSPRQDVDILDRPSHPAPEGSGATLESLVVQKQDLGLQTDRSKVYFVLPAYNEEDSLPPLLDRIQSAMTQRMINYEVIVVDDGSADGTAMLVSQATFRMPIQLVQHGKNQGLGAAIRTGLKTATDLADPDDVIVTMDADNTQPPEIVHQMAQHISDGCDIVVASRFQKGAKVTGLAIHRHLLSFGARWMYSLTFPIAGLRDFSSGFRAYRAGILQAAFERYGNDLVTERGFACMTDLMIKIRKLKPRVCEVPMELSYGNKVGASKMKVLKTVFDSLRLIAKRRIGRMK